MAQEQASGAFEEALLEDDAVALYERAPCGYVSTTPDGRIVKANQTFLTWSGYSRHELTRRCFVDLLTVGGRIYHETHYSPLLHMQGSAREIAFDMVRSDGTRLPVLVNALVDEDAEGRPTIIRIAVFDATERREYERELLRAKQQAEESEGRARALARTLQSTFVPSSVPAIPGLDVAGAYRPAGDGTVVGGDFYDVFPVTADEWMVVLGDVCGKGPEAAVVTAFVRHSIRVLAVDEPSPGRLMAQVDQLLRLHGDPDRYCTCVLVRLARVAEGWRAVVSVGGHPPPVLVSAGSASELSSIHGPLIGLLDDPEFTETELHLAPGDGLVIYTDGIIEARAAEQLYGSEALVAAIDQHLGASDSATMDSLVSRIVSEALDFQSGNAHDDIAAVGLRVR